MVVFILLLFVIVLFLFGVVVGLWYGLRLREDWSVWTCTCKGGDGCLFYGTKEQAERSARRCLRSGGQVEVVEVLLTFDPQIIDVTGSECKSRCER